MITQPHQSGRAKLAKVFDWRLVMWGGAGGIILTCLALGVGLIIRPNITGPESTPVLTEFPGPTSTWTPADTTETPAATPTSSPPPSSTELDIGAFVAVSGTEGDGLRMRDQPGLEGTIIRLAVESEVFQIEGGPEESDGYIWWYVVNPYDPQINGWVVSNFLRLVEE
jgi:hypothetical protein